MNKTFEGYDFNFMYGEILHKLLNYPEHSITNRKGNTVHEIVNSTIEIWTPNLCYATMRNMSMPYLMGELLFYLRSENKVKNIEKYSKFWKTISDDNVNLNSCYGYYIYKMPIPSVRTNNQFDYCLEQLTHNKESKKAVMTIYSGVWHSYKTKDNPCTMFMQFLIRDNRLSLIVNMRSNDVWFGLPYDVPFFCFVQQQMFLRLKKIYKDLKMGSYVHKATSLHLYDRNIKEAEKYVHNPMSDIKIPLLTNQTMKELNILMMYENNNPGTAKANIASKCMKDDWIKWAKKLIDNNRWISKAWEVSKKSRCLKKEVGGIYVKNNNVIASGWSGRPEKMDGCTVCARKMDTFYQDGCNSIHSEYRAMFNYCKAGKNIKDFNGSTVYLTHGPCDQCMKLLIELGVKKCVFDVYYKTNFKKYAGFIVVEDKNGRVLCQ